MRKPIYKPMVLVDVGLRARHSNTTSFGSGFSVVDIYTSNPVLNPMTWDFQLIRSSQSDQNNSMGRARTKV